MKVKDEGEKVSWKLNIQKTKIMASGPIFIADRWGNSRNSGWISFGGSKVTEDGDCSHEIRRWLLLGRKVMTDLDRTLKRSHYSANKGPHSQGCGLQRGHVWLWELDCKEGRMPKNRCLWTVVLEKTPGSPLDSKEIRPVNLKGSQRCIFTGRTDAEAEAPVFWSSGANRWLNWKSLWCWERWRAEGEEGIRGWDGWRTSQMQWTWTWKTSGDGEGQGDLASCSPWGHKELDTTAWLNNNNVKKNTSEQAGLEHPNFPTALINKSLGKFLFVSQAHISTMSKGSCVRTKEPFSSNTLCSKISIYCRTRAYLVMY